jgi:hypothetical protein
MILNRKIKIAIFVFACLGFTSFVCLTSLAIQTSSKILVKRTKDLSSLSSKVLGLETGDITELTNDQTCSDRGEILVYAESDSYVTYICGNKQDINQSLYFKAHAKSKINGLSINGKAILGWQKISFVGTTGNHSYSLTMPSNGNLNPNLNILPLNRRNLQSFSQSFRFPEKLIKYLSVDEFKQSRDLERWWRSPNSTSPYSDEKKRFLKYFSNNSDKLKVCEIPSRAKEKIESDKENFSRIYKIDNGIYILELTCDIYNTGLSYNFWLIKEKDNKIDVNQLIKPKIILNNKKKFADSNEYKPSIFFGGSLYDPRTKNLSLLSRYSGAGMCGKLTTFNVKNNKLELLEYRDGDDCENTLFMDPLLYNQVYP